MNIDENIKQEIDIQIMITIIHIIMIIIKQNNNHFDNNNDNNNDDKLHNIFPPYINEHVNRICFEIFDKYMQMFFLKLPLFYVW